MGKTWPTPVNLWILTDFTRTLPRVAHCRKSPQSTVQEPVCSLRHESMPRIAHDFWGENKKW
jgi:hypothetical protein